jgi:hypothetical protein
VTATIPAFRALPREMQQAAGAAAALALTMLLPWYQWSHLERTGPQTTSLSAVQVFGWVEAAVLLVCAAVLYLVWARSQRKAFHLPGGDGTVIMAAGGWILLLLLWRLFDKPSVGRPGDPVGIEWGLFVAILAAGLLTAAGARVRAAHRPEPPNPAADDAGWVSPPPAERRAAEAERAPVEATAVTEAFRRRPGWEGEPPEGLDSAPRRPASDGDDSAPPGAERPAG